MKTREEILAEIKSAMTLNSNAKATCNEALTHAMSLIVHEAKELEGNLAKEYHRGLSEAWEVARELCKTGYKECTEMFGDENVEFVIKNFNPLKVKSILDSYKEEKEKKENEIIVGDIVSFEDGIKGVVMDEDGENIAIFTENGCVEAWMKKENVTKVKGKHIEINDILKLI